jgi:hypothetical protein
MSRLPRVWVLRIESKTSLADRQKGSARLILCRPFLPEVKEKEGDLLHPAPTPTEDAIQDAGLLVQRLHQIAGLRLRQVAIFDSLFAALWMAFNTMVRNWDVETPWALATWSRLWPFFRSVVNWALVRCRPCATWFSMLDRYWRSELYMAPHPRKLPLPVHASTGACLVRLELLLDCIGLALCQLAILHHLRQHILSSRPCILLQSADRDAQALRQVL